MRLAYWAEANKINSVINSVGYQNLSRYNSWSIPVAAYHSIILAKRPQPFDPENVPNREAEKAPAEKAPAEKAPAEKAPGTDAGLASFEVDRYIAVLALGSSRLSSSAANNNVFCFSNANGRLRFVTLTDEQNSKLNDLKKEYARKFQEAYGHA